ncbi:MAG: ABC transporter permease, partial [Bacteroidota bacterium]
MYTSLKHAFRILFRYRLYTLFAWLGLSIAVSSVWFIAQYVQQTQSFDAFHPEPEVIYRVTMEVAAGSETEHYATTGLPLGEQLQAQYPGVMAYARLTFRPGVIRHQDATFQESGVYTANSETFQVFGFDWLEGSTPSPLAAPNSLVLTESLAQKYFPTTQAVGQTLMVDDEEYTVAGVFRDWPGTSHLEVQALLAAPAMAYDAQSWFDLESYTYLRLNPSSTHTQLNEQLQLLQERELVPIMEGSGLQAELYAQPLPEVYFSSGLTYDVPKGNRAYVYALTGAGWLIFLVAALNFVNLNLTRSTQRTKEILVKKTLGMSPRQLWWQSGYESLGVTLLVVILAGVLVLLLRPYYESFTGLPMAPFQSMASLAALLVVSLLGLGLLGSGYSGTYLSFQRPTLSHISTQRPLLKHLLLGFQYTLAVILLVITLGMGRQLDYMRQKDMGFAQEHLLGALGGAGQVEVHKVESCHQEDE